MIAIATEGDEDARGLSHAVVEIPAVSEALTPFLSVLPMRWGT